MNDPAVAAEDSPAPRTREDRLRWERLRQDARGRGLSRAAAIAFANSGGLVEPEPEPPPPMKPPPPPPTEANRVRGLRKIPQSWLPMPDNASLAAEIGWVQANRITIVEERDGGASVVTLDRARSPAPSWAALGWLETSIRSYAKYVDIVAKALSTQQDEAETVRRERMAIDEIRALLDEMHRDQA